MATTGSLVVNLLGNTVRLEQALHRGVQQTQSTVQRIQRLAGIGAIALAGMFSASSSLEAARTQIQAEQKLAAVISATGGAVGLTAREISQYASELQAATNFGDELTISAAAVLATFKGIKGDVFKDALASAQDLSTVMGSDLQTSALQVGKALNDPIKGITALSRAGVSFTEQQKRQIAELQQSGDLLGAQKIILQELQSEFGGAARAMADPWRQLQNVIGDVSELFGFILLPAVNELSKGLQGLLGPATGNAEIFQRIGNALGAVVRFFVQLPGPIQLVGIALAVVTAALLGMAVAQRAAAIAGITFQAVLNPANLVKIGVSLVAAAGAIYLMDQQLQAAGASTEQAKQEINALQKSAVAAGQAGADGAAQQVTAIQKLITSLKAWRDAVPDPVRGMPVLPRIMRDELPFPEVSPVTAEVREMQEALVLLHEQMRKSGDDSFLPQVANIESQIAKVTGIGKAIEDTRRQISSIDRPQVERDAKLQGFLDLGATDAQVRELDRLMSQLDAAKAAQEEFQRSQRLRLEGIEEIARLRDEIGLLNGTLTESQIALRDFASKGLDVDQLRQIEALTAQRDHLQELEKLKQRATQIAEQTQSPADKMAGELAELQKLRDAGLLTADVYDRARRDAEERAGGGTVDQRSGVGTALAGSQEAVSSILRAAGGGKDQQMLKKADEQIAAIEKTNLLLTDLSHADEIPGTDLT